MKQARTARHPPCRAVTLSTITHMADLISVVLIVLATHRLTVLIVEDRVTSTPRQWIQNRREQAAESRTGTVSAQEWQSAIAFALSCLWCMSIWVGGAVTLGATLFVSVPLPVLTWLAASSVTALLGGHRA